MLLPALAAGLAFLPFTAVGAAAFAAGAAGFSAGADFAVALAFGEVAFAEATFVAAAVFAGAATAAFTLGFFAAATSFFAAPVEALGAGEVFTVACALAGVAVLAAAGALDVFLGAADCGAFAPFVAAPLVSDTAGASLLALTVLLAMIFPSLEVL